VTQPSRFSDTFNSQNAMVVYKVEEERKKQILFVRSCMPMLHEFISLLKKGLPERVGYSIFNSILRLLEQIMNFLFNIDGNKVIYYEDYREDPIVYRQKILKDFKVLEALTDVIYLCKVYLQKPDTKSSVIFWIEKISGSAYHALRYSIREYRPNELYCFQWIDFILEQIVQQNRAKMIDNEAAGRLFTELVDNNEKILDSKINAETIKNIVKFLIDVDTNKKYVKILRAFCICNNKGVLKNQVLLSTYILMNAAISNYFIFKIELEEEEVFVSNKHLLREKRPLKLLHEESARDNDGKVYGFFIEVVHFLADLCYEGNSNAIKVLQRHYDFDVILDILNHEEVSFEVKHAFCHLFTNLWVDLPEHPKLKADLTVVEWEKLKDVFTFPVLELDDIFRYKPIKYYISQAINYQFVTIDMKKKDSIHQLCFLNEIINLSRKMMELGIYTEIKEINSLVKGLKKVLTNSFSFHENNKDFGAANSFSRFRSQLSTRAAAHATVYDNTIAIAKLRECRISICYFFEFISKIQVMLKEYTLIFRMKNLIQTSCNVLSLQPASGEETAKLASNVYYQGHRINQHEIINKIGFLINNMMREDSFIKIGGDHNGVKNLITVLLSMSTENNLTVKKVTLNMIMSLFSNCSNLTESVAQVIGIENSMKEFHERVVNLRTDLNKVIIQFKTMTEISVEYLYEHIKASLDSLISLSVVARKAAAKKEGGIEEPEREKILGGGLHSLEGLDALLVYRSEYFVSRTKQDVIRGTGVLELLINLVSLTNAHRYKGEDRLDEYIQLSIFKFMAMVIQGNEDNQLIALKHIDVFWDLFFGSRCSNESLMLLFDLVSNHKRLLIDENLSSQLIRVITIKENLVSKSKDEKRIILLNILARFCEYRNNPIKRNQIMIIKNFIEDGSPSSRRLQLAREEAARDPLQDALRRVLQQTRLRLLHRRKLEDRLAASRAQTRALDHQPAEPLQRRRQQLRAQHLAENHHARVVPAHQQHHALARRLPAHPHQAHHPALHPQHLPLRDHHAAERRPPRADQHLHRSCDSPETRRRPRRHQERKPRRTRRAHQLHHHHAPRLHRGQRAQRRVPAALHQLLPATRHHQPHQRKRPQPRRTQLHRLLPLALQHPRLRLQRLPRPRQVQGPRAALRPGRPPQVRSHREQLQRDQQPDEAVALQHDEQADHPQRRRRPRAQADDHLRDPQETGQQLQGQQLLPARRRDRTQLAHRTRLRGRERQGRRTRGRRGAAAAGNARRQTQHRDLLQEHDAVP